MWCLNLTEGFKPLDGYRTPHGVIVPVIYSYHVFSGGEPHIRIHTKVEEITITTRLSSMDDLGKLMVAVDALRRMGTKKIKLFVPYFPAARQDRVANSGESLTVKVYADIINAMKFDDVAILDPHSDVTPALLDNCTVFDNIAFATKVTDEFPEGGYLVSPDAGSVKKIAKFSARLSRLFFLKGEKNPWDILFCEKSRDTATGELTGFKVFDEEPLDPDKPYVIIDDICDGGGTFIGLAKELKKKGAKKLYLAVTHGIFSKGFSGLNDYFETIYSTDSFPTKGKFKHKIINIKDIR